MSCKTYSNGHCPFMSVVHWEFIDKTHKILTVLFTFLLHSGTLYIALYQHFYCLEILYNTVQKNFQGFNNNNNVLSRPYSENCDYYTVMIFRGHANLFPIYLLIQRPSAYPLLIWQKCKWKRKTLHVWSRNPTVWIPDALMKNYALIKELKKVKIVWRFEALYGHFVDWILRPSMIRFKTILKIKSNYKYCS